MVLITFDLEVFQRVAGDIIRLALDVQLGEGERLAAELQRNLLGVVVVDVAITTSPDEVTDSHADLLSDDVRQQRIACDVERHAEERIS